ncbi:MAG: hypothetical protein ACRD3C_10710 [Vicinamibacterales bacterium]
MMDRSRPAHQGHDSLSFLTPYWSGCDMMRVHLRSVRTFYPTSPILVSKRGGGRGEMEAHRAEFGIQYWLEEYDYVDALLRLLARCETQYACIVEHDTALLSSLDGLLAGLQQGRWDLVGMEERVRDSPYTADAMPSTHGWWRFAPGQVAGPLLMFNWSEFKRRWGLSGVRGRRSYGAWEHEYDYGIGQKLTRHKYLLPFHTTKYGIGTILKDDDTPVLWHQWYGSYRTRFSGREPSAGSVVNDCVAYARHGETAFLADYPNLDLSVLHPAWGPGWDIRAEQDEAEKAYPGIIARAGARIRQWRYSGWRGLAARIRARVDRWCLERA